MVDSEKEKVRIYKLQVEGEDSINSLKDALKELNERLKELNSTSKEYEETLKEITELQDKLSSAIKGVSDSYKDSNDSMKDATDTMKQFKESVSEATGEEGLGGMKEKADEVISKTIELDESLLKEAESMKELRSQIKSLRDRLVQLQEGTDEYKETVEVLVQKQSKLSSVMGVAKRDASAAAGSINAMKIELNDLQKRYNAVTTDTERKKLMPDINRLRDELKKLNGDVGLFQMNVGDYRNAMKDVFGNPRQQIRALRQELAGLEVGSERYNQVLLEMADLTQRQKHFNDQLRFSSANLEDIFKNSANALGGLAAGFSILNSNMILFGSGSEDVQKAMLKIQALMAMVQGFSKIANLKDQLKGLWDGMKAFASRFGTANKTTKEFTDNTKAMGGAAEQTTGALDAQASAVQRLSVEYEHMNEKEKSTITVMSDEISERQALIEQIIIQNKELDNQYKAADDAGDEARKKELKAELNANVEKIKSLREEISAREESIEKVAEETRQRMVLNGEITKEQADKLKNIELAEKENYALSQKVIVGEKFIQKTREEIAAIKEKAASEQELTSIEEFLLKNGDELIKRKEQLIAQDKLEYQMKQMDIAKAKEQIATETALQTKLKQQTAEMKALGKAQGLSIAQKQTEIWETKALIAAEKADIAQKKGQVVWYRTLAATARLATVSIKTVKTALISSGIGALLVVFGKALSVITEDLMGWLNGQKRINAELDLMNTKTKELESQLKEIQTIADGFGFSSFKKSSMEITKLIEIMKSKQEEFDYAIQEGKKDTDELRDAWYEAQEAVNDALLDSEIMIDKLIADVEKADRQKGMTQLEKDLEETNKQFQDAIDLVKKFGEEGVWSADRVEAKIKSLNNALAKQTQMLTEAAASATTANTKTGESEYEKQRKEAKKLLEELEEEAKTETERLRAKYEKQKKLLEKFHLDTTKLTEKYYKDLDKIRVEANKKSYDSWKAHLDAEVQLMQNAFKDYEWMMGKVSSQSFADMLTKGMEDEIPVMKQKIDNMMKDFEYTFGKAVNNPFESFFDIQYLDEFGSKAIAISDEIADSMKEMGLDPTNIEDIETMIDKWNLDKKAIEDANKELVKYKSNIKMTAAETQNEMLEMNLERMTTSVENEFSILETQSKKFFGLMSGWYDGMSPQQEEEQFNMRYQTLETGLQQEYDLWKKMADDETLTVEDRNNAILKLNDVIARQNAATVQKTIDKNNLMIKSFQNVSNSINSMANNIAGIFGTVSDVIMESAEAQLAAGEISQKAYEEQFETAKAYQIANSIIATIAAAVQVFASLTAQSGGWGIAAAIAEAAAILAAGFAQVQQIRNTKPETSSAGGGGSASSMAFNLPNVLTPEPQRVQNTTSQDDIDRLANALGDRMNDQRVYLVESDVENALNKSEKRRTEVSF